MEGFIPPSFPFFCDYISNSHLKVINNPAGKYRLKELFPNNGVVNQGSIIINSTTSSNISSYSLKNLLYNSLEIIFL
jgi:hypothetical protein